MSMKVNPECIDCANSHSTENDELVCILTDEIVPEDGGCEDFN